MTTHTHTPRADFASWDADDALDALYRAGLDIHHVAQARWPEGAPQPRTHRQAFTFRSAGSIDPHLLLVFDAPDDLDIWLLWLARFWKARPYLSVRDNILLLVSRDLSVEEAARFHAALARLSSVSEPQAPPAVPEAAADERTAVRSAPAQTPETPETTGA